MLIHGKLILTQNGFLLDEVKSLLQKALRRKERTLIASSAKELIGKPFGEKPGAVSRDQLQWKALVNYLFEDHCLSDTKVMERFHECFQKNKKLEAIQLLSECYTSRVAACLPVVAIGEEYMPDRFGNKELCAEFKDKDWSGLIVSDATDLNPNRILYHLKGAWEKKDLNALIICMKLCSMIVDIEKGHLRSGGERYLLSVVKKPNIGHVVTSFLYKHTDDQYWKDYLKACFDLLGIPDICVRLVLFTIVAHVQFKDDVKNVDLSNVRKTEWENVEKLTHMPSWAVDKHTFRGKFGKGTSHLIKKKDDKLSKEDKEEFHGVRQKVGLEEFFDEGCICMNETLAEAGNPYWEQTKKIYFGQPPKLQKTVHMTGVYYKDLKKRCPFLFKVKRTCLKGEKPKDKASSVVAEPKQSEKT